jgi:signal transduction histidine kinase
MRFAWRLAIPSGESSRDLLSRFQGGCQFSSEITSFTRIQPRKFLKNQVGAGLAKKIAMQSLDSIYLKMAPGLESSTLSKLHPTEVTPAEGAREISREVAHELNNVLTIIRGYTERLLVKNADNPAFLPDLKLISENARRAEIVIRQAARGQRNQPQK